MLSQRLSDAAANMAADNVAAMCNGGTLCLYDGVQPARASDPIAITPLATLGFAKIAFADAESGTCIANPIESEKSAKRTGKATWFRAFSKKGLPVFDGSVGTEDSNLNANRVDIQIGAAVFVSRLVYKQHQQAEE